MTLNAMQLNKLSEVSFAEGYLREITEDDLCYLPYWTNAFEVDCNIRVCEIVGSYDRFKNQIGKNTDYLWIDKIPVAMAGSISRMMNGAKIGRVYTPPFNRNKGYSTSCVWHLSKMLLDEGNKFVSLFADADYPVSNKVYQKIGFRNVCLYREIKFE
jgi:predicted GNAT family acetyltransferase